MTKREHW